MAGSTRARDARRSSSNITIPNMTTYSPGAPALSRSADVSGRNVERGSAEARKPKWQARLSLGQVVVMWSVIAGSMVMVFLFGLYAGREQGLRRAFEEYGGEAVRLAVANPIPNPPQPIDAGSAAVAAPAAGSVPLTGSARASGSAEMAVGAVPNVAGRAALAAPAPAQLPPAGRSPIASERGQTAEILALETGAKPSGSKVAAPPDIDFAAPTTGLPSVGGPSAAGAGRGPTIQLFKDDAERQAPSLENKPAGSDRAPGAPGTIGALARGGLVIDRVGEEKPTAQALASQEGQSPKLGVVTSGAAIEKAASERVEKEKIKTVEQGKGRWFVQVAAARTRAEANAMNKKLARAKLKGKIEEAKVGRNTYYRVVVGPYSSKDAATVARGAVKRAKAASGEPFVRQAQ